MSWPSSVPGPIGLAAITGSLLFSPSHVIAIDLADTRLEAAKLFGADVTVNNSRENPLVIVQSLTDGLGADVAIEAVGTPATFELAASLVRPGGHIANIGVHGEPATLHLETLWTQDVTITTGLVDTSSTPTLSRLLATHQLDAARFATHHFTLDQMMEAYDVFSNASETGALKVVLRRASTGTITSGHPPPSARRRLVLPSRMAPCAPAPRVPTTTRSAAQSAAAAHSRVDRLAGHQPALDLTRLEPIQRAPSTLRTAGAGACRRDRRARARAGRPRARPRLARRSPPRGRPAHSTARRLSADPSTPTTIVFITVAAR